MTSAFECFVAFRYLRSKRKEVFISIITVISVLAVAVSVMVLNIVLSVMTGFESELQAKLISTNAHIVVRRIGGDLRGWKELQDKISSVPDVTGSIPFTQDQALITGGSKSFGMMIRGIADQKDSREKMAKLLPNPEDLEKLFSPPAQPVARPDGSVNEVRFPGIIVGRSLAARLGLREGEVITLLSPKVSASPHGLIPRYRRFQVVGVYSSGLIEYENGLAYISLEEAQNFFDLGAAVSGIEVSVKDLFQAARLKEPIIEALGGAELPYYATDWTEPNKALWEALELEKKVYFTVLLLLVFVASFSIVSTLVMVVMEKSKDIAIFKSMGASNRSILKIFIIEGSVIGFLGTVLGTILGVVGGIGLREFGFEIDESVFSLSTVPVHLIPVNFIVVGVASFFITSLAGIYPAYRAAKLKPAEALRYE